MRVVALLDLSSTQVLDTQPCVKPPMSNSFPRPHSSQIPIPREKDLNHTGLRKDVNSEKKEKIRYDALEKGEDVE